MPLDAPENRAKVGYVTQKEYVETEAALDTDNRKNRVFKIVNENIINPMSGTPVGYKIMPHYSQMLLADPSSLHAIRSEFADYPFWVTRYHEEELYASGSYTLQSTKGTGVASYIRSRSQPLGVRNEDIVVWHTFGLTHNPRVEDWPVMPTEKAVVSLKPINFFNRNPALDVQISNQEVNRSILVEGAEDLVSVGEAAFSSCSGCPKL